MFPTLRQMLAINASEDSELHWLDVQNVFLNGYFFEDIYKKQPEGFVVYETSAHVHKHQKAWYGVEQALWKRFAKIAISLRKEPQFPGCAFDLCFYDPWKNDGVMLVSLYVDDIYKI